MECCQSNKHNGPPAHSTFDGHIVSHTLSQPGALSPICRVSRLLVKALLQAAGLAQGPCTADTASCCNLHWTTGACNLTQPTFSCAPGALFFPLRLNMSAPAAIKARQPCSTPVTIRFGDTQRRNNVLTRDMQGNAGSCALDNPCDACPNHHG